MADHFNWCPGNRRHSKPVEKDRDARSMLACRVCEPHRFNSGIESYATKPIYEPRPNATERWAEKGKISATLGSEI